MKKMVATAIIVATWMLTCMLANAAELPAIPPIPKKFKNIRIVKPDPSVPKEIAAFLGEWEGVVRGREPFRRVKIIIYEVSPQKIKFLYGCGDNRSGASIFPGGWSQYESDLIFENDKYRFSRRAASGFAVHYYFENGSLGGMESAGPTSGYQYELEKIK